MSTPTTTAPLVVRPRILLVNGNSAQDDHAAILDGVATALTAADRGQAEFVSRRHLCVGTAGPFVRLKGEARLVLPEDADPAATILACLDRPVGNEAVRNAIEQALRAMAGLVETDAASILVEAPTPWQNAAVTLSEDPMRTSAFIRVTGRDRPLDPEMEALLPDVVVVGGSMTELTLSPLGWGGMRSRTLDAVETLRCIHRLRAVTARLAERMAESADKSTGGNTE